LAKQHQPPVFPGTQPATFNRTLQTTIMMKKPFRVLLLVFLAVFALTLQPLLAEPHQNATDADSTAPSKKTETKKSGAKSATKQSSAKSSGKDDAKTKKSSVKKPKTETKKDPQAAPTPEADKVQNDGDSETQPESPAANEKQASGKTTKGVKTEPPSQSKSSESGGYDKFLEKYGAWDRLSKEYSSSDDPDLILKRAVMALQTGAPQQALEILESSPSFDDQSKEVKRLWLGGQAARAAGDPSKAVFWFSQAGQLLDAKERNARFQNEPDLDTLWTDVWRRFFWIYSSNFGATREGQEAVLRTTLEQAQRVWKNNPFWDAAAKALEHESAVGDKPMAGDVVEIGESDRLQVAKALAAACLEYKDDAKADAEAITAQAPREFWAAVTAFIASEEDPSELASLHSSYPKASIFWGSNTMSTSSSGRTDWLLPEESNSEWQDIRKKNRSLKDAAKRYVDREPGKELEALPVFGQYRFALAVASGKTEQAQALWTGLEKRDLPLSLKVCGMLLFDEALENLLPEDPNAAARQYFLLPALASAGGGTSLPSHLAPFWIRLEGRQLTNAASRTWPLDRLLVLSSWTSRLENEPSADLAKRIAFLFPETSTGAQATLRLAEEALKDQQYQLTGFYLNNVETIRLPKELRARQLELKGDLAFGLSNFDEALDSYSRLLKTGVKLSDTSLIRVAFILQQKGQLDVAQGQLEKLWERHENMPPAMQAEVLYYLGEGAHAMGNIDKALDYYLRLAWQYPQENIWALTAMFRAALIYDNMGQYDTAKNLLVTVIRNAETEQQREAAKNRLAEIEAKMGKVEERPKSGGTMVYPF